MRRFLKDQALSIAFLALFLGSLLGQAIAGHQLYNNDEVDHASLTGDQADTISFWRYLVSSHFGNAVMENWQSEYLQFVTFLIITVWLIQRGSTESKEPGKAGRESDEDQQVGRHADADSPKWARVGGWRQRLYENSLLVVMATIWIASWFAQSVTGWSEFNSDQLQHRQHTVSWLGYLGKPDFWEATFQNWQSEFLAVGSMVVLSIYLRQRGSPQSKPVGAGHHETGVEG
ncbi:MAG: hypothetical protein HZB46_18970 [Solirubrobacterales bacterium]|nr:hypothetical protein [Solirubrobacterales bacterium]